LFRLPHDAAHAEAAGAVVQRLNRERAEWLREPPRRAFEKHAVNSEDLPREKQEHDPGGEYDHRKDCRDSE
jgi:hypothetical protein